MGESTDLVKNSDLNSIADHNRGLGWRDGVLNNERIDCPEPP
jgi:hypothetical protein